MKPSNVDLGRVEGRFIVGIQDGADVDDEPDFIAAQGTIEFTASVPYLPDPTASPVPVTLLKTTIRGVLDSEGYLCSMNSDGTPKTRGLSLVATDDPDLLVQNWTWNVTYRFTAVNGSTPTIPAHGIAVPMGATVDLTTTLKVPSSPGYGLPQSEAAVLRAEAAALDIATTANETLAEASGYASDAESAKNTAVAAAAEATAPTDAMVAGKINDPGSLTGTALSAAIDDSINIGGDARPTLDAAIDLLAGAMLPFADTQVKDARPVRESDAEWVLVPAAGHGWVPGGGASSFQLQANGGPIAPAFFRFITLVGNKTGHIGKSGLGLNLTRKGLRLWIRLGFAGNHTVKVRAGSADMANRFEWLVQSATVGEAEKFIKTGEWVPVTLSFASASTVGSPTRAAIDTLEIETTQDAGGAGTFDLGGISAINQMTQGTVSITFDDGYAPVFNVAKPIMDARSLKGTAYVIPSVAGTSGFMSIAQMHTMQDAGWDISTHHLDDLSVLTDDQLDATLKTTKAWLVANGFRGADHFAYPMGRFKPSQFPIWARYFATCRTTVSATAETTRPAQPMRLRNFYIAMSTTVAQVTAAIEKCRAEGSWLILCLHNIITTPTAESTHWSTAQFTELCDYLSTNKVNVQTVSETVRRASY